MKFLLIKLYNRTYPSKGGLITVLVQAIKEQDSKLEDAQKKLDELKSVFKAAKEQQKGKISRPKLDKCRKFSN